MKSFVGLAFSIVIIANSLFALSALAAGDIEAPTTDERYARALHAIEQENWRKAMGELREVVKDQPQNADAWNWMGYAARNAQRFDLSWDAYDRALAIDPGHLGAMNYLGHLYIVRGDITSATEMLQRLADTCGDCAEHQDLAQALDR